MSKIIFILTIFFLKLINKHFYNKLINKIL